MAWGRLVALLTLMSVLALPAAGQIYNWSTGEVIPGTEGITPGPGMILTQWYGEDHNLRYADLSGGLDLHGSQFNRSWLDYARFTGANLTDVHFDLARLTGADLSGADLTNADFRWASLTGADLSGTTVRGADFADTTSGGFVKEQFYSTASYQTSDLSGIRLCRNDLTDWNLVNQNLTAADFLEATLTSVDLSGANLTSAQFCAAELTGANLSGANLTNANFYFATLTGAGLSGATVVGASFCDTTARGFTKEQFYSTASYQAGDLRGITLIGNCLV